MVPYIFYGGRSYTGGWGAHPDFLSPKTNYESWVLTTRYVMLITKMHISLETTKTQIQVKFAIANMSFLNVFNKF